jgi:gluconokinase
VIDNTLVFIVMGVSGSGKTTIGKLLAGKLGAEFVDADDYHSVENKAKMNAGHALTDQDRLPWLQSLHQAIVKSVREGEKLVLACSALKRQYRELLQGDIESVQYVYLQVDQKVLAARLQTRKDHFVGENLLPSQFAALEEPAKSEALIIDANQDPDHIIDEILEAVSSQLDR